ncbi:MAG TPA: hypothetical protein VGP46_07360 [Acidimicrobiales bacterium]|nr:hypothetical protein [Acidimicrobiales bacterium]
MTPETAADILHNLHTAQAEFYAGGDDSALRDVLDADVAWHIPGRNAIAGDYFGLEAVLRYMTKRRAVAKSTLRLHPGELLVGSHDHVAALTDGSAVIDGVEQRWSTVGLYRLGHRQVLECRLLPFDAGQFDRIWQG